MKAPDPWPKPPEPQVKFAEFTKFTRVDEVSGAWTDTLTGRAYRTLAQLVEARKKKMGKNYDLHRHADFYREAPGTLTQRDGTGTAEETEEAGILPTEEV